MRKGLPLLLVILCAGTASAQPTLIDSLLRVVDTHPRDTNGIKALDLLASEYMRKDLVKAKLYTYRLFALAKTLRTDFGLASGYSGMVGIHQQEGHMDSASYYLDKLETLAKNSTNKKAALNFANSAGLFYKNQGKTKEALPYLLEALALLENGDKTARAGQMLNVGNAYSNLGEIKKAADYHLKALVLFEEVKNKRGQSFCLNSLGTDYFDLRQYSKAEKYFYESEKLKEELDDKRGVLNSWMNLGMVYQQTNKPDLAVLYYSKALTRARELDLLLEESRVLFNMGSLLKQTKKQDEATKTFSEAITLARQAGDSALVSRIKTYLIAVKNDAQAEIKEEQTLLQNIRISSETGSLDNHAEAHMMLAEWYATRKQFDKAYEYLKQGQLLSDSMRGSGVIFQLKKLEEEYNAEKKEKEIALLKKDQELQSLALSRQRALNGAILVGLASVIVIGLLLVNRYRVANNTKRLLEIEKVRNNIARDLHDDIGSTLSSINILSRVALVEQNGNTQNYLQRIGDQSTRMMEDMSDMVWSINPRNDSMEKVITRMREFASEILESSGIEYRFSEKINNGLILDSEKRKNLFLIFKEAINNAAKYSNADRIEIDLLQQEGTLILTVKDNGQGFDEQKVNSGNGLRNLRERAKEINGSISLNSIKNTGTELALQLPIA